jgi:uncharacterized protein YdeI (YjbR/CyaY-like superfamily)
MIPGATVSPKSRAGWRAWLERHYLRRDEIWVVYYKKHTGKASVSYDEAVEEAICFGWIDGLVKRVDDERHMQRFTPRRKGSVWSAVNLRRFARLVEQGLVMDAGHAAGPKAGTKVADVSWLRPDVIPEIVERLIGRNKTALKNLKAMAPSYRKHFVYYIDSAKRPETRERRAQMAIALLEQNITLEMSYRSKLQGETGKKMKNEK